MGDFTGKGAKLTEAEFLEQLRQRQAAGLEIGVGLPPEKVEVVQQPVGVLLRREVTTAQQEGGESRTFTTIFMEAGEVFLDTDGNRVGTFEEGEMAMAFLPDHTRRYINAEQVSQYASQGVQRPGTYVLKVRRDPKDKTGWILGALVVRIKGTIAGEEAVFRLNGTLGTDRYQVEEGVSDGALPQGWSSFNLTFVRQHQGSGNTIWSGMSRIWNKTRLAVALAFGPHFSFAGEKDEPNPKIQMVFVKEFRETFIGLTNRSGASQDRGGSTIKAEQWVDNVPQVTPSASGVTSAAANHEMGSRPVSRFGAGW